MATLDDFFTALCRRMGWEPTPWRLNVLKTMAQMEGTGLQAWNPLDTMHPVGAVGNWNSAGVKIYPNQEAGVEATARTLEQSNFTNLRQTFKDEKVNQGTAADLATWGWAQGSSLSNTILGAMGGKGAAQQGVGEGVPISAVYEQPVPAPGWGEQGQGEMGPPDPSSPRYYGVKQVKIGQDIGGDIMGEVADPTQFNFTLYNNDFQSWKDLTGQLQDTSTDQTSVLNDYLDAVIAATNADIAERGLKVSQASQRFQDKVTTWDKASAQYTALLPYTIPEGVEYIPGFGPESGNVRVLGMEPVKATPIKINPYEQAAAFIRGMPEPVAAGSDFGLGSNEFQQALDYLRQYGMQPEGEGGGGAFMTPGSDYFTSPGSSQADAQAKLRAVNAGIATLGPGSPIVQKILGLASMFLAERDKAGVQAGGSAPGQGPGLLGMPWFPSETGGMGQASLLGDFLPFWQTLLGNTAGIPGQVAGGVQNLAGTISGLFGRGGGGNAPAPSPVLTAPSPLIPRLWEPVEQVGDSVRARNTRTGEEKWFDASTEAWNTWDAAKDLPW